MQDRNSLKIENLVIERENYLGKKKLIDNINIEFTEGLNLIYGEPGAGKSTFLETIAGILKYESGTISNNHDIEILLQQPDRQFIYSTCIEELNETKLKKEEIINAIELFGLESDIINLSPWNLSFGEKKRLALARILLQNRHNKVMSTLLFDDPFGHLDVLGIQKTIKNLLTKKNKIIIMTTSDKNDLEILKESGVDYKLYKIINKGFHKC